LSTTSTTFEIRPVRAADRAGIIELLTVTQQWTAGELFERFFAWKHEENPLGASAAWVAVTDDRVVAFRPFLRWEFEHPDGRIRRAVRAVDAATHPDHQRRGIFRQLTTTALETLTADGVDFVFNTPNAKSRAGELQLGWSDVGRLATAVRPRGLRGLARVARARVPAERWSVATTAGDAAADVLADPELDRLLASGAPPRGLRTHRTAPFLRWRYRFDELAYRAVIAPGGIAGGIAIFRVRRRGPALEGALCDVIVPAGADTVARALVREVCRVCGADYVIRLDDRAVSRDGFVRLPGQGPMLVARPLARTTPPLPRPAWKLALGDIELF
jgi:hypothetical protein